MRRSSSTFGAFFIFAGVMHFVVPRWYKSIIPPQLPAKGPLVYGSGVAEILGGVGVLFPKTRPAASWLSIATLLSIFPANIYMALEPQRFEQKTPGGRTTLYARLPPQVALIAWAHAAGRTD